MICAIRPTCSSWNGWPKRSSTCPVSPRCSRSPGRWGPHLTTARYRFRSAQQSIGQIENLEYQRDRAADLLKQADELRKTINILQQQYALQQQLGAATHQETQSFHDTVAMINDLRDKIANFDDFFRPIRSYFYWEPHCYDIPACWALRSIFDAIDGIDELTEQFQSLTASLDKLDSIQSKLLTLLPPQIASQETNLELTLSNYATNSGINNQSTFAQR